MEQTVQFDFSLLRGRIREFFQSEKNFVEALQKTKTKISIGAFNNKINGRTDFTETEIYAICNLLNIPIQEVYLYFFKEKYELNS